MRLHAAITRLLAVIVCQTHLGWANHVVGISMIVGIRIFSIEEGSSSVAGLSHGFGRSLPEEQDLRLPRRRRRPGGV